MGAEETLSHPKTPPWLTESIELVERVRQAGERPYRRAGR